MTEETVMLDSVVDAPDEGAAAPAADTTDKGDEGGRVEFTPAQQARFNQIYREARENAERAKETAERLRRQEEATARIAQELMAFRASNSKKEYEDTIAGVQSQMEHAMASGDYAQVTRLTSRMADLQAEAKLREYRMAQEQQRPPQTHGHIDAASMAADEGEISRDDYTAIKVAESEKTSDGRPLRPWMTAGHPHYQAAVLEAQAIWNSPLHANKSPAEKIAELDRRFGVTQSRAPVTNVMGGNLTTPPKKQKIELTDDERATALAYFQGKTDKEKIERFIEAKKRGASGSVVFGSR